MPAIIAVVDQGVDYLTCTYNAEACHGKLELLIARTRRREHKLGNRISSWGLSGYTGEKVGGLEWGERHDGRIVRMSGETSALYWKRFALLSTNCSRIDLQQTVVVDEPVEKTLRRHWREMRRWYLAGKRRPKPRLIAGPTGPESVYSGERVSDIFLRMYHRGAKKKLEHFHGHLRYEAEFKADRARLLVKRLLQSNSPEREMVGQCLRPFHDRGIVPLRSIPDVSRIRVTVPSCDVDRCLAWLRKAVRPSVRSIIDLGYGDEVFEALGLVQETKSEE